MLARRARPVGVYEALAAGDVECQVAGPRVEVIENPCVVVVFALAVQLVRLDANSQPLGGAVLVAKIGRISHRLEFLHMLFACRTLRVTATPQALTAFLGTCTLLGEDFAHWAEGRMLLRFTSYLTERQPPIAYVTSARCLVLKGDAVLVQRDLDSEHILPVDRREAGPDPGTDRPPRSAGGNWLVGRSAHPAGLHSLPPPHPAAARAHLPVPRFRKRGVHGRGGSTRSRATGRRTGVCARVSSSPSPRRRLGHCLCPSVSKASWTLL